jgi:hypothetical protein
VQQNEDQRCNRIELGMMKRCSRIRKRSSRMNEKEQNDE